MIVAFDRGPKGGAELCLFNATVVSFILRSIHRIHEKTISISLHILHSSLAIQRSKESANSSVNGLTEKSFNNRIGMINPKHPSRASI